MQHPDLILIHRSAFFHSLNHEIGLGYAPFEDAKTEQRYRHLYQFAEDKLLAFMGYIGFGSDSTQFIIYSRGGRGQWKEADYRRDWIANVENRFPALEGRVWTMDVTGEIGKISFRDPATARIIRDRVQSILGIGASPERQE